MLFVWLICSTLLSKCFTSVLLNVYAIKKASLTVQTFEDIANNPDLLVAGYIGLKDLEPYRPDIFQALKDRVIDYHKRLKISLLDVKELVKKELIKDVISRKSVIITSSFTTEMLKLYYQDMNLMESEQKYSLLFRYSLVSKHFSKHKDIYNLLVYNLIYFTTLT